MNRLLNISEKGAVALDFDSGSPMTNFFSQFLVLKAHTGLTSMGSLFTIRHIPAISKIPGIIKKDGKMKRVILSVMLALLFLNVMPGTALADPWNTRNNPELFGRYLGLVYTAAHQFEGRLTAYSNSGNPSVERQVFLASEELSASLEELNAAVKEAYPDLDEEDQRDVEATYSALSSYLHELAAEANQIFQSDEEKSTLSFEVIEGKEILPNTHGDMWVGSATLG